MNILFWGLTVSMLGKLLLAGGVLIAHSEIAHEKRIDQQVLKSFRIELMLTIIGIILIVAGYIMEVYFYSADTELLRCSGPTCEQAAAAILSQ